ncbi:MAG: helicase-related protein [Patescibacteria group bacterium]
MSQLSLIDPLSRLPAVTAGLETKLNRLDLKTIDDLLRHLPTRYEDYRQITPIGQLSFDQLGCIRGRIAKIGVRKTKRQTLLIEATVVDDSGSLPAIWFNQRYLLRLLKPGDIVTLYGLRRPLPALNYPFFVSGLVESQELAPIYPTTAGLSQKRLRLLIAQALDLVTLADRWPEGDPDDIEGRPAKPRSQFFRSFHQPTSESILPMARQQLALEEIVLYALQVKGLQRSRVQREGRSFEIDRPFLARSSQELGITMTVGQRQAPCEIIRALAKAEPISWLLYGEVGSGKTAVGMLAAAAIARAGWPVVWLSPTVALASQLHSIIAPYFQRLGYESALVSSASKQPSTAIITVATQAIFARRPVSNQELGLVIVDEQHRFGVGERQNLLTDSPKANLLMMTATPIPRTLAQTIFGHLQLSSLEGRLPHQKPVITRAITDEGRFSAEAEIARRLKAGQPGYVVCGLIDPPTAVELLIKVGRKAIRQEESRWRRLFPKSRIVALHGQMRAKEKIAIVGQFRSGEIDILLATSVVEVGIDNPQATWMLIENADCFGLATLHQLRGRVGRGHQESVCYLVSDKPSERLKVLEATDNGLEIAEFDLKSRGPGQLAGYQQSGLPGFKLADFSSLAPWKRGFALAEQILEEGLEHYPDLQKLLQSRKEKGDEYLASLE